MSIDEQGCPLPGYGSQKSDTTTVDGESKCLLQRQVQPRGEKGAERSAVADDGDPTLDHRYVPLPLRGALGELGVTLPAGAGGVDIVVSPGTQFRAIEVIPPVALPLPEVEFEQSTVGLRSRSFESLGKPQAAF
mgnify:CR=1 FL=1|jgi:hypothetical protein